MSAVGTWLPKQHKGAALSEKRKLCCKYPTKTARSFLEIFRHTDYVPGEIAMRKIRFTEHQIMAVLKSVEAGSPFPE